MLISVASILQMLLQGSRGTDDIEIVFLRSWSCSEIREVKGIQGKVRMIWKVIPLGKQAPTSWRSAVGSSPLCRFLMSVLTPGPGLGFSCLLDVSAGEILQSLNRNGKEQFSPESTCTWRSHGKAACSSNCLLWPASNPSPKRPNVLRPYCLTHLIKHMNHI